MLSSQPLPQDIDVQLLRCLVTLMAERHVTRAAEKMGMSQSGMSAALGRLRHTFNDPLLVRTPQGMEPTERGLEIVSGVQRALLEIQIAVNGKQDFDPASSAASFNVMASDYISFLLMPALLQRVASITKEVCVKTVMPEPRRVRELLVNGEVDLVVGFYLDVADTLYQTILFEEPLVCIARADHPALGARALSMQQYRRASHICYGGLPNNHTPSMELLLERTLPALGIERNIQAYLPSLVTVPHVVAATDLIATVPEGLARRFSSVLPLKIWKLPFPAPVVSAQAIWHERMHSNAANKWLRECLRHAAQARADGSNTLSSAPDPRRGPRPAP